MRNFFLNLNISFVQFAIFNFDYRQLYLNMKIQYVIFRDNTTNLYHVALTNKGIPRSLWIRSTVLVILRQGRNLGQSECQVVYLVLLLLFV